MAEEPLPQAIAGFLSDELAADQLVLFAGAGLSMQAVPKWGTPRRMPSWRELMQSVAAKFGEKIEDYQDEPISLFDAIVDTWGRPALESFLAELLDDTEFNPSPTHQAIAELSWSAVCTTNYDTLLERAMGYIPVCCEHEYDRLHAPLPEQPRLFKLHGSITSPHTLTGTDYRRWRERNPRAFKHVENLILNKTILFVGYSLTDAHWRGLVELTHDVLGNRDRPLYALTWQSTEKALEHLRRRHRIMAISLDNEHSFSSAFLQIGQASSKHSTTPIIRSAPRANYLASARGRYVRSLHVTYAFANLHGINQGLRPIPRHYVTMQDIYVELDLRVSPLEGGGSGPDLEVPANIRSASGAQRTNTKYLSEVARERQRLLQASDGGRRSSRLPARQVLITHQYILIVGPPGQGKSTLLRDILLSSASAWTTSPETSPFPFLDNLSGWSDDVGPPHGRLLRRLRQSSAAMADVDQTAVDTWLEGQVIWLLDGIDEIRGLRDRMDFEEELLRVSAQRPADRFVVTTRPAAIPTGGLEDKWVRADLLDLTYLQCRTILSKWAKTLRIRDDLSLDPDWMTRSLWESQGLHAVRTNTLLLTMAVVFFRQSKRLPYDRWEFYDGAERALRDSWPRYKLSEKDSGYLPGSYSVAVIESIALSGLENGQVLFSVEDITFQVRQELARRSYPGRDLDDEPNRFVAAARDLIGVLIAHSEDCFSFIHLTFQEFLAARALLMRPSNTEAMIRKFWGDPDWEEVWLFYALGVQDYPGRFEELLITIIELSHSEDNKIPAFRLALRLLGVGTIAAPSEAVPILEWATVALEHGSFYERAQVLSVLELWERPPPPSLLSPIMSQLGRYDMILARQAFGIMKRATDHAYVCDVLAKLVGDDNPGIRSSSARILSESPSELSLSVLLMILRRGDLASQFAVLEVLAPSLELAGVKDAILEAYLNAKNGSLKDRLLRALAHIPVIANDSPLIEILESAAEDPSLELALIEVLRNQTHLKARPSLADAFRVIDRANKFRSAAYMIPGYNELLP